MPPNHTPVKFRNKSMVLLSRVLFYPNIVFSVKLKTKYVLLHRFYLARVVAYVSSGLLLCIGIIVASNMSVFPALVSIFVLLMKRKVTKLNFLLSIAVSIYTLVAICLRIS